MLSSYFVGFVRVSVSDGTADASIGGSGTLVSVDEVRGVLTAGHVIEALMRDEQVGLVLSSRSMQRIVFPTNYCRSILLYEPGSQGPDLGLLVLPPDTLQALDALMSFHNLTKWADRMLGEQPPLKDGFWGLTGFGAEFTEDCEPPKGFTRAKVFRGGLGSGIVTDGYEHCGFDYLKYEALYNEVYEGPSSFGGFSGGGLWQVLLNLKDDIPVIRDRTLCGVAFYQSERMPGEEGDTREIICHGRQSIYRALVDRVRIEFQ